ncbi:unnamed protein product [Notodromas monacha]|uniref:Gfo/Idh/MocA-like oxidoreductase C-terminal domain-containing protein n=2 Tax=Notodromas monacha TaxID=399045 RepID=A0A7R9C3H7_9CRUS|nr:unnamed protein product [Notodromas monacha]CAG0925114.1 unnamed protein product [Notodromas monacha]
MFEFDDGSTATLTMIAFSESLCDRYTTFYGTRGQMGGCFSGKTLEHFDFLTREKKSVPAVKSSGIDTALMGHGGTDFYLMDGFIKAVSKNDPTLVLTGVEESLKSHLLVFAAETARRENRVVTIQSDPQFFTIDLPEVQ